MSIKSDPRFKSDEILDKILNTKTFIGGNEISYVDILNYRVRSENATAPQKANIIRWIKAVEVYNPSGFWVDEPVQENKSESCDKSKKGNVSKSDEKVKKDEKPKKEEKSKKEEKPLKKEQPKSTEAKKTDEKTNTDDDSDSDLDLDSADIPKVELKLKPTEKKGAKKKQVDKSSVIYQAFVNAQDIDFDHLYFDVISKIAIDGLLWNQQYSKKDGPFGIKVLTIGCVIEDDKVTLDAIEEALETVNMKPEDIPRYLELRNQGLLDECEEEFEGKIIGSLTNVAFSKI